MSQLDDGNWSPFAIQYLSPERYDKRLNDNVTKRRLGIPGGSAVENLPAMQETWLQSLGSGRAPGGGNGHPVLLPGEFHAQRSLEGCIVHGVAKSHT